MEHLLLVFFLFTHLLILHSAEEMKTRPSCPRFTCGRLGQLKFPFNDDAHQECGLLSVSCKKSEKIQFEPGGRSYQIVNISQSSTITINDPDLKSLLNESICDFFDALALPNHSYVSYQINPAVNLYKCSNSVEIATSSNFSYTTCGDYRFYYSLSNETWPLPLPPTCLLVQLPSHMANSFDDLFTMLSPEFSVGVNVKQECYLCYYQRRGQCQDGTGGNFHCSVETKGNRNRNLVIGLVVGIGIVLIGIFSFLLVQFYKKRKVRARHSAELSSKSDLEGCSAYFGVPIFSHSELEEATNNFDTERELGDGGFGIVYHGKLRDGREVAVKRLFEHNYKRVQQFMNEIQILTLLRHKNLVTLYGCTSRRSRELLLVYEYIPNGTVADHLHGERAKSNPLPWAIRMNIAIETASALAYLHASEIIHRDVKTNNILLDNNFCVKVADFGLSRLFPFDVTHVSTAPQGTPGYVDPDYHQCYQLTSKSDVYSFGVVLIELISSMPAVDISRHRHEINLASYAINKIQKCAFDELIDPCLGHKSYEEVQRMTTSVAELAFRCLQQDKEMRPTMQEVLEELQRIQSGEYCLDSENRGHHHRNSEMSLDSVVKQQQQPPASPECDEVSLLDNVKLPPGSPQSNSDASVKLPPASPISVTDKWISTQTTPNASASGVIS